SPRGDRLRPCRARAPRAVCARRLRVVARPTRLSTSHLAQVHHRCDGQVAPGRSQGGGSPRDTRGWCVDRDEGITARAGPNLPSMETATEGRRATDVISEGRRASRPSTAGALLVAMRPGEWIKNVLVFAGLVFAKKFNEPAQVADALFTFVAFCAISSAGYLFNDLGDVELDRRHPDKRYRPIA